MVCFTCRRVLYNIPENKISQVLVIWSCLLYTDAPYLTMFWGNFIFVSFVWNDDIVSIFTCADSGFTQLICVHTLIHSLSDIYKVVFILARLYLPEIYFCRLFIVAFQRHNFYNPVILIIVSKL